MDCYPSEALHDYHYDYYNFYPSTESFYSDDFSMDADLQEDLCGLVSKYVGIEEYVQHVYSVSKVDIEHIRSKEWKPEGLSAYAKRLDEGAQQEDLDELFKVIMGDLFSTFTNEGRKLDVHHACLGKTTLKSIANVRTPEQLFFFGSHDDKSPVAWSLAKAFVKLAATPRIGAKLMDEEGTIVTDAPAASARDSVPTGTKRKRCSADTRDGPTSDLKRPKLVVLNNIELQAAGYALELMASTCRRWATGVVITDTQVTLHYYDRMGAIFTQPFKFDEEPWKLALFALAIGQCNLVQAGFEPLVASNTDTVLSQPLLSLQNSILRVPKDSDKDSASKTGHDKVIGDKVEGEDLVEKVWSHFAITGDPLYVYDGVTGRGSHVLPGDLVEEAPPQDHAEGVASKRKQAADSAPEGAMVVKFSWPMETRPYLEADTIKDLVEKIPWMSRHLPRIHCAISLQGEYMGLPRRLFHDMTTAYGLEQRYFTLLFSDCYKHLWDVKTLIGFQLAYIDILECHHTAAKYGKMLHRDISENNLLWTNDKRVVGILNDWDLATPVDADVNSTNRRTGTGPFMAYDLLGAEPPVHLYRHDLESLFYVLIWAAVHYNLGSDIPYTGVVHPALKEWDGDYEEARMAKHAFLGDPEPVLSNIQPVFKPLKALWIRPLCDLFRKAQVNRDILANLEARARRAREEVIGQDVLTGAQLSRLDCDDEDDTLSSVSTSAPAPNILPPDPSADIDFNTLGGCLTYENFLAALDHWKPRPIPKKYREHAKQLLPEE